jgi:hypothetical protein
MAILTTPRLTGQSVGDLPRGSDLIGGRELIVHLVGERLHDLCDVRICDAFGGDYVDLPATADRLKIRSGVGAVEERGEEEGYFPRWGLIVKVGMSVSPLIFTTPRP